MDFQFIGWCVGEDKRTGSKHDKVWTCFKVGEKFYAAWGARGKSLNFKDHGKANRWEDVPSTLSKLIHDKKKKGYKEVDAFQLFAIFPDFETVVDQQLMFKMLSNKVM